MDIASLGIKIDTSDVAKAERELDGLAASGNKAEAAAKGTGEAWSKVGQKVGATVKPANAAASAFKQGSEAIKAQQAELGKLIGKIDPVVAALDRLDSQEKKLRGFKAGGLIDTESFNGYKAKIDAARASLGGVEGEIRRTGLSAKQSAQSLRQLPMQFSDIAISLQAGQNPMTVFLQQGAQIKDSFGGIGPALRETAKYAAGLVNPFTVAAAAAVVLALAYKQGSDEASAYNKAIILTGNQSGVTAGRLAVMARAIDAVSGTQRQAASVLAEVAGSGKFTADQLQGVALAAIKMENVTGKAISETVSEFKKLADEPAAASAKLNEQYGYLTASVYAQIQALEDQGEAAGAAELAIDTFGQAMESRAGEIESNLGLIEGAWEGIKSAAAEAWDEMLGIGREDTLQEKLNDLAQRRAEARYGVRLDRPFAGASKETEDAFKAEEAGLLLQAEYEDGVGRQQAMLAQANKAAITAQQYIGDLEKQALSNAEKRTAELEKYRKSLESIRLVSPADIRLDPAAIAKAEAGIADKFKDPKAKTVRAARAPAARDDAATRLLFTLREQQSVLQAQLAGGDKLTAQQRAQAAWAQQLADIKTKGILTADQKSLLVNQESIKAQLDKNAALASEMQLHADSIKLQERYKGLVSGLRTEEERLADQMRERLDLISQMEGISRAERDKVTGRVTGGGFTDSPEFEGLRDKFGGAGGEFARLDKEEEKQQEWYDAQLDQLTLYREEHASLNAEWDAQELDLKQQHSDNMTAIDAARKDLAMSSASDMFGSLASLTGQFAGEQSEAYKMMFAASKAFAIADAAIKIGQGIAAAVANPWPINIAAVASTAAMAAGMIANIQSVNLAGMAHDGIDSVPKEGTWLLDKGERVVDRRTNQDLKRFLMPGGAGSGSTPDQSNRSVTVHVTMPEQGGASKQSGAHFGRQIARAIKTSGRYA